MLLRKNKGRKNRGGGELTLAVEKSDSNAELSSYSIWIYGESGVGKTTFSAEFPATHHFMTEPGAKSLNIHQRPVAGWQELRDYAALWEGEHDFQTAAIDIVELAYKMCLEKMCEEMGIEHPGEENDRGKSWGRISDEFMSQMTRFMSVSGKGCVLISHAVMKEVKAFDKEKYDKIVPNLGGQSLERLKGAIDVVGYMYRHRGQNWMRLQPDELVFAKVRPVDRFLWPDGTKIETMPLGTSAREAYERFSAAFRCELPREDEEKNEEARPKPRLKLKRSNKES